MSNAIINSLTTQYYGNYRGIVKQHGEHGRCKIFIPGVYPEEYHLSPNNLPDAEPAQPLFAGGLNGNGMFQYPELESKVWLFFENGDHNRPIYFAATLGGAEANNNFKSNKYIIKTKSLTITIDDDNDKIDILEESDINVTAKKINLNIDEYVITSPKITITAMSGINLTTSNLTIKGNINVTGTIINNGINMTTHKHICPIGGITTIPV